MPRRSAYQEEPGAVGARNLSPEGRAFRDRRPMLSLRIWCQLSGVAVVAHVDRLDERGQLVRTVIANTEFRPPKVSERLIVEWGERCLRAWLEDQLDPKGPPAAWRANRRLDLVEPEPVGTRVIQKNTEAAPVHPKQGASEASAPPPDERSEEGGV